MSAKRTESDIVKLIMLQATRMGARLLRNQVGMAYMANRARTLQRGETYTARGGETILFDCRKAVTGLGKGSPDLVGWSPMVVTPEHVGRSLAVFAGVEVKRPGQKPRPDQQQWLDMLASQGALAGCATSPEDLNHILFRK